MSIRLRQLRRDRDMTLAEVAEALGTTPQTVSRLENQVITLTKDWLEKFCALYGVSPGELLGQSGGREIPHLGLADGFGAIDGRRREPLILSVPAVDPVAVRLTARLGPFASGDVLIASRSDDLSEALNHNALIGLDNGGILIRRPLKDSAGKIILMPLDPGIPPVTDASPSWTAKIVMRISYL